MDILPIPDEYLHPCDSEGTLEELSVPDFSPVTVYLPYGYGCSKRRYNVFYLLHGGGGNHRSFFSDDGLLKNMLDHMIANNVIDSLIVVTPTYYPPEHSGDGIAYSVEAVRDFGPILLKRIVPLIDSKYRTYDDPKHRGIGGFSMGAVATWYALMAGLDIFSWFMPMSGDCWICGERGGNKHARQTAALIADTIQGREFHLQVLTGSEDIAFPNLDPQMKAMRKLPHVFSFGKNVQYRVLEGGVHDYPTIRRYIYNALPDFFR